jgi:hypothetical protein
MYFKNCQCTLPVDKIMVCTWQQNTWGQNGNGLLNHTKSWCCHHMILNACYMHSLRTLCIAFRVSTTQLWLTSAVVMNNDLEGMCMSSFGNFQPTTHMKNKHSLSMFTFLFQERERETKRES